MTGEREALAALAAVRERWSHPPLEMADVEERVAIRLEEAGGGGELVRVVATPPACRVFLDIGPRANAKSGAPAQRRWRSAYVHALGEVDALLSALLQTTVG